MSTALLYHSRKPPPPFRRGVSYPLAIVDGRLQLSSDLTLVREAIIQVLETRPSERVMRPTTYGTPDYTFTTTSDFQVQVEQIRIALDTQILAVDKFIVTGRLGEDGVGWVEVQWVVLGIPQPPINFELRR